MTMETPIERRLWIKSLAKRPKMSMMRESCSLRIHQPPVSDQGGISGDTRRLAAKFATLGTGYKQNAMYSNLGVWLPSCIAKEARVVSQWYTIILSNYIQFSWDIYSLDSHILCSVMANTHFLPVHRDVPNHWHRDDEIHSSPWKWSDFWRWALENVWPGSGATDKKQHKCHLRCTPCRNWN